MRINKISHKELNNLNEMENNKIKKIEKKYQRKWIYEIYNIVPKYKK